MRRVGVKGEGGCLRGGRVFEERVCEEMEICEEWVGVK